MRPNHVESRFAFNTTIIRLKINLHLRGQHGTGLTQMHSWNYHSWFKLRISLICLKDKLPITHNCFRSITNKSPACLTYILLINQVYHRHGKSITCTAEDFSQSYKTCPKNFWCFFNSLFKFFLCSPRFPWLLKNIVFISLLSHKNMPFDSWIIK